MKIKVTAKDIRLGLPYALYCCPVALAVRRIDGLEVRVKDTFMDWGACRFQLPLKARQFIRRFDAGKPVKPFTFELKLK